MKIIILKKKRTLLDPEFVNLVIEDRISSEEGKFLTWGTFVTASSEDFNDDVEKDCSAEEEVCFGCSSAIFRALSSILTALFTVKIFPLESLTCMRWQIVYDVACLLRNRYFLLVNANDVDYP